MKVKTSISLSEDVLHALEEHAVSYKNRSAFAETAVWTFIKQKIRDKQNARDLTILSRRANTLNKEAQDVLTYLVQSRPCSTQEQR
jgi:metal-responsive CopG/Arc/MetJ family transcriptional regulator